MSYNDAYELQLYLMDLMDQGPKLYDRYRKGEISKQVIEDYEDELDYVRGLIAHYDINHI